MKSKLFAYSTAVLLLIGGAAYSLLGNQNQNVEDCPPGCCETQTSCCLDACK